MFVKFSDDRLFVFRILQNVHVWVSPVDAFDFENLAREVRLVSLGKNAFVLVDPYRVSCFVLGCPEVLFSSKKFFPNLEFDEFIEDVEPVVPLTFVKIFSHHRLEG